MAKLGMLDAMMVVGGGRYGKSAIPEMEVGRKWRERRKPGCGRTGTVSQGQELEEQRQRQEQQQQQQRPGARRVVEYRVRVAFDRELEMELNGADGEGWIVVALWRNVANSGGVESTTVVWGRRGAFCG